MNFEYQLESITTPALDLHYFMVPWDSEIMGWPVGQVEMISVKDTVRAKEDIQPFQAWLRKEQLRLVSCRLRESQLTDSMLLEELGFKFIEMVYHPRLLLESLVTIPDAAISVRATTEMDVPELEHMASSVFRYERFYVDPRLDPALSGLRYASWVRSSFLRPEHRVLTLTENNQTIGFFVIERRRDGVCIWHLTAIAPRYQGRGYGKRVWNTMIAAAASCSVREIQTTISARNIAALNLYARLGFTFGTPELTFHWVRS